MRPLRMSGVMVLVLLMAAWITISPVTAENSAHNSDTKIVVNENGTMTIDGITLPVVKSQVYPLPASESDTPLTREQFLAVNQPYIEFLTEKFGKERADHIVNDEIDRRTDASSPGANSASVGNGILFIDPVGDHVVGENFFINGTAILPAGIDLTISIYRGSFNPGIPPQRDPWYDHIPTMVLVKYYNKTGNIWSYAVNTTGSYPDEYLVSVKYPRDSTMNATAIFHLVPVGENTKGGSGAPDKNVITIDPIPLHHQYESFTISGTTNLPPGDELLVEVYSANHTLGPRATDLSGAVGVVKVRDGSEGKNSWYFTVNSTDLKPDDYKVIVTSYRHESGNDTLFSVSLGENDNRSSNFSSSRTNPADTPASPLTAEIAVGSLLCATFPIAGRIR
jgi:hypothetical protein